MTYYLWVREVKSRYLGHPSTFEAQIFARRADGFWSIIHCSSRHKSKSIAMDAGYRLAKRNDIDVESDPKKVRQAKFKDQYGDD